MSIAEITELHQTADAARIDTYTSADAPEFQARSMSWGAAVQARNIATRDLIDAMDDYRRRSTTPSWLALVAAWHAIEGDSHE